MELALERVPERGRAQRFGYGQPGVALLGRKPSDQFRIKVHSEPRAAAIGPKGVTMLQVVIEAAVRHGRQQGLVRLRVQNLFHIDVIERLAAKIGSFDSGNQLLLDGPAGIFGSASDCLLDVHA